MNPPRPFGSHRFPLSAARRLHGMTLVIVLAILVLFGSLVLAIFYTSQVERQSSSLFAGSMEARTLADTAVNLCIAQITDATTQTNRAWISQPGLIRTFKGDRIPDVNYRLYSWSDMRPSGAFDPDSSDNEIPTGWDGKPALYVDLNEPLPSPDDPQNTSKDKYPILYPPGLIGTAVAGYKINGSTASSTAHMPVQWLYVLKDGSIRTPQEVSGNNDAVTVAGASADNPVTGRIAFWADDESAKVNVNTAAGGEFWTAPWLNTPAEQNTTAGPVYGFGFSMPVRGEFQRYPGHPARTDLRAVFPDLSWEDIYSITPRIFDGGSKNGTVLLDQSTIAADEDTDRLFASLGELRFAGKSVTQNGDRQPVATAGGSFGVTDDAAWTDMVEKRKGFLTASSRAPEMTLFGTPRVTAWPISAQTGPGYRSAVDQLIAFCSTIRDGNTEYPFYFTRKEPFSATADISLSRNTELFGYLQRMTAAAFPGVSGNSFASKYGSRERDQILTEIFDYIRSANLQDMQLAKANRYSVDAFAIPTRWTPPGGTEEVTGFGRAFAVRQIGFQFICTADEANAESNVPENRSLIEEGDPVLLQSGERRVQALLLLELFSPSAGFKQFVHHTVKVSGLENLTLSGQNLGFQPGNQTSPVLFKWDLGGNLASLQGGTGGAMSFWWMFMASKDNTVPLRPVAGWTTAGTLPYVSVPVTLNATGPNPTMTFSGGNLTIEVFHPPFATPVSTIPVTLDPVTLPIPSLDVEKTYWAFHKDGIFTDDSVPGRFGPTFNAGRGLVRENDVVQTYILPHGDSRMLFAPDAPDNEPSRKFEPVPVPTQANAMPNMRHFLSAGANNPIKGFTAGTTFDPESTIRMSKIDGAESTHKNYYAPPLFAPPNYPADTNAPWTFGDWDTGSPWDSSDGPLINKPDEGNIWQFQVGKNPYAIHRSLLADGINESIGLHYHTVSRQMPSPAMFGSLPTGMIAGKPWQTLLFRPDPGGHPGAADPPDHLLLDLFWVPVVEPYAISEPFSTAGKVNMNWQMVPFTHIERSTAMHALLRDEKLSVIPDNAWASNIYEKRYPGTFSNGASKSFYPDIDVEETLKAFRTRFSNHEVFLTASEITELPLVPVGATAATMTAFWNAHRLTGENMKERPYAVLYPRLTTKSNVFNVHYRVQSLKKKPDSNPEIWDETKDHVIAEFRGNTLIERFIDMNRAGGIPDYATTPNASAEGLYRFRILSSKEFN